MKLRSMANLKILCREHKADRHSATAHNSLLIPLSFPQGPFSPLEERCGPPWWGDMVGCPGSLSRVLRSTACSPTSSRSEALLKSQHVAPATPLLEFCAAVDWNTWNTWFLEHCLSLEKAQCFPALSHPLLPGPGGSETDLLLPPCRWERSHREVKWPFRYSR